MAGIKIPHGRRALVVLIVVLGAAGTWVWARSTAGAQLAPTAVLRVDTSRPGNEFALGTVGLSTEAQELGTGRLSAGHPSLVRLMRLLGPSVLRIGGGSVDYSWWTSDAEPPPPWATSTVTPTDLSALRGLLRATGWKVLLGVDFGHFEPARTADEARYAREILGTNLLGIEIGNEPNGYGGKKAYLRPSTYGIGEYLREAEAYRQALNAATPGMAVYGPAAGGTRVLTRLGAAAGMFTELTQHYYPANACSEGLPFAVAPSPTGAVLLSPAVRQQEDEILDALVHAGAVAGRSTRIGETGSSACNGDSSAAPVFASALWSLDWALRAASSGVKGLNFQGHLGVCGSHNQSPICALTTEAAQVGDVTAQPEYYGLLAARQLEGGRFVPTSVSAPSPLPNLTTWATLGSSETLRIVIDNFATAGPSQPVRIAIPGYSASTEETLISPSIEARGGIVLGGAHVIGSGQWRPTPARLSYTHGSVRVTMRPASAVIVTLRRKRSFR
jgi:hypothetical protein